MEELGRAHEPEEANNGELKDVVVEQTVVLVFKVKPVMHGLDEGEPRQYSHSHGWGIADVITETRD